MALLNIHGLGQRTCTSPYTKRKSSGGEILQRTWAGCNENKRKRVILSNEHKPNFEWTTDVYSFNIPCTMFASNASVATTSEPSRKPAAYSERITNKFKSCTGQYEHTSDNYRTCVFDTICFNPFQVFSVPKPCRRTFGR